MAHNMAGIICAAPRTHCLRTHQPRQAQGKTALLPSQKQIQHLIFHGAEYPDGVGLLEYSADTRILLMTLWAAWENAHILIISEAYWVFRDRTDTNTWL